MLLFLGTQQAEPRSGEDELDLQDAQIGLWLTSNSYKIFL